MNRLGLSIVILITIILAVRFWMKSDKPLSSFNTTQCIFEVDNHWASEHQKKIVDVIKDNYKSSNNPEDVIQKAVEEFKEIKDMKAEICGADAICFHAYGFQPIFILGDTKIVVDNGSILEKKNFDQTVVEALPKITTQKAEHVAKIDQTLAMVHFIQSMPNEVVKQYSIDWRDKNYIVLQSKKYEGMKCLVSDILIPNEKIFKECSLLYDLALQKLPKRKQKNHMVEYDIRFKNQIIVRSGGNYG